MESTTVGVEGNSLGRVGKFLYDLMTCACLRRRREREEDDAGPPSPEEELPTVTSGEGGERMKRRGGALPSFFDMHGVMSGARGFPRSNENPIIGRQTLLSLRNPFGHEFRGRNISESKHTRAWHVRWARVR